MAHAPSAGTDAMTRALCTLSAIGRAAEEEMRAELAACFPDARLIGPYEIALLRQMLDAVWQRRAANYVRQQQEGETLGAAEKQDADEEAFRNGGRYRAIRAAIDAAHRAKRHFLDMNPDRANRRSILDRISAWRFGDYHWLSLTDCLAYRADREAGRVQEDEPNGWRGHFAVCAPALGLAV